MRLAQTRQHFVERTVAAAAKDRIASAFGMESRRIACKTDGIAATLRQKHRGDDVVRRQRLDHSEKRGFSL